jgi:hypothetical protein
MKELIDIISLFDPKTATKARKIVRVAKVINKITSDKPQNKKK